MTRTFDYLLIVFLAAALWLLGGSVAAAPAALLAATFFVWRQPQWKASPPVLAIVIALAVAAVAAVRIGMKLYGGPTDLSSWFEHLVQGVAEVLLICTTLSLAVNRQSQPAWLISLLAIGCLFFALAFQSTVGEHRLYLVWVLAFVLLLSLKHAAGKTSAIDWGRWRIQLLLLAIAGMCAWVFEGGWTDAVSAVKGWFVENAVEVTTERGRVMYSRDATLWNTTRQHMAQPNQVALRVFCDTTPGYLRGRTFDEYHYGEWSHSTIVRISRRRRRRETTELAQLPSASQPQHVSTASVGGSFFALRRTNSRRFISVEVWNDPLRGSMYYLPLNAAYLQGTGEAVDVDADQIVIRGLQVDKPYIAHVPLRRIQTTLSPADRSRLLAPTLPPSDEIAALAEQVCGAAKSPQAKIELVESHFRKQYEYTLEQTQAPRGVDPLEYFLLNRPAAHCEFFASGAVTLLRLQGVPCRYVTGFVATELESEYGDYWLARNRNAHAWCEAYDSDQRQWVIVEATPGIRSPKQVTMNSRQYVAKAEENGRLSEALAFDWRMLSLRFLLIKLRTLVELFGFHFISAFLVVGMVWFLLSRLWKQQPQHESPHFKEGRLLREKVDRYLQRNRITRDPAETPTQFASRLKRLAPDSELLARIADWYEQYARRLYSRDHDWRPLHDLPKELSRWFSPRLSLK